MNSHTLSRRVFMIAAGTTACAHIFPRLQAAEPLAEPLIDIHQHTHYWGRDDTGLVLHQQALGATKTVLLPGGTYDGLEGYIYSNESCLALVRRYPDRFVMFANETTQAPDARATIEKYLKLGAIGIGEQKFRVESDSVYSQRMAELAQEYNVPLLLHFQYGKFNTNFARFERMLEKYPRVNFIGHAQTVWGNIDRNHDQSVLYPTGKVTQGGLTDRWLRDYPNFFADLSAGSGLNSVTRDEEHARGFFERHQNKLLYGSDCQDVDTKVKECCGIRMIEAIRRLASPVVARKLLYENAKRVLKIT
jgi:uncharacterized protein